MGLVDLLQRITVMAADDLSGEAACGFSRYRLPALCAWIFCKQLGLNPGLGFGCKAGGHDMAFHPDSLAFGVQHPNPRELFPPTFKLFRMESHRGVAPLSLCKHDRARPVTAQVVRDIVWCGALYGKPSHIIAGVIDQTIQMGEVLNPDMLMQEPATECLPHLAGLAPPGIG